MRGKSAIAAALLGAALSGCGATPSQVQNVQNTPSAENTTNVASTAPTPSAGPSPSAGLPVPAGVTVGVAVFDRQSGAFTVQLHTTTKFRSASLVKLLIALDFLWNRGPDYAVPAADKPRLDIMLRSSDDTAATALWKANGQRDIVTRMAGRLGLRETAPPPAAQPGFWGYTALSAADLVRIYRYLLERAPAPVRDYIMGNLHQSTKCGTDRYDQSFGIPSAFAKPWAAKQGWSGFGDKPANPCTANASTTTSPRFVPAAGMLSGDVLHTTGTVGGGDRAIVVVLTQHPDGGGYSKAFSAVTKLTRALNVPGATPA